MIYQPENFGKGHSTLRDLLEMCLQLIAGVRDPWTLTDEECDVLGYYADDRSRGGFERLRREPGLARKAACAFVADSIAKNDAVQGGTRCGCSS